MTTDSYIIILEVIIALLGAYLVYYARQKGKNQADKEDLREITDSVEEVKQKYTEENELLRATLNLLTNKKNILFTEEKEAIIQYFSHLNKWIWDGLNIQITEYNHNNFQDLSDRLIRMRDDYNQTNIAFGRLQLLCLNQDLISVGHEANKKTLELHQYKESKVKKLQRILSWEKLLIEQISTEDFDFNKLSSEMKDFFQSQAKENGEEKQALIDEYFEKHIDYFKPALEMMNKFKELGKEHLNK